MTTSSFSESSMAQETSMSFEPSDLSTEDCKYLLRSLEMDAFATVMSALRAQGPFSKYKEALFDHLRNALCISEDRFKAEMRRATNDQYLCRIASKLNPSYDVFSDWATAGQSFVPSDLPAPPISSLASADTLELADQLLRLADEHNKSLDDRDGALVDLVQLPKKITIPEVLRPLLQMSAEETDSSKLLKTPRKGRKRAADKDSAPRSRSNSVTSSAAARSETPASLKSDATNKQDSAGKAERKSPKKSLEHSTPATPDGGGEQQGTTKATKQRTMKPRDNASCTCARVHPFVFAPIPPGQKVKPPRGNPDRRTSKRVSPATLPQPLGHPSPKIVQQIATSASLLRSVPLSPSTPATVTKIHSQFVPAIGPTLVKRARTTSTGETFARQLTTDRARQQITRGYVRPISSIPINGGSGTKFVVSSQAASAAYSNPTRPYYGNPSAAAMGITVRPAVDKGDSQLVIGQEYGNPAGAPVLLPAVQITKVARRPPFTTVYASSSGASTLRPAIVHADSVVTVRSAEVLPDVGEVAAHEQSVVANESNDSNSSSQSAGE
uniref:ENT domain-containing protein n=1 Tax=Plectus sambesii TaxID=2011161 RepID=A0A914VKI6_9BILA